MGKKKNRQEQGEPIQVPATSEKPAINLSGVHVIFVGGLRKHGLAFVGIVEKLGGTYAYHDGGMEDNVARLDGLASRASAIILDADHISHAGAKRIKELGRQHGVPVAYLERSGAGAFEQALEKIQIQRPTTEPQPKALPKGVTKYTKDRVVAPA